MRGKLSLLVGVCAAAISNPVFAQTATDAASSGVEQIIVTAQRQSQRLQDVPIAVSAFTAENLEKQQIKNTSDLQLTLPNVTFTKTNFTSASFTIRGIGDLCTGVSCDSATAIHLNDAPLFSTRLFEGEFYDLAQIEVLRGPQGTLFGRNATSGVVNIRTAKPNLNALAAAGEVEYGNYNSIKVKGMLNVPITQTLAVRAAGFYLKRDGYTKNLYDGKKLDDRDLYGLRGSLTWEPGPSTTIDIVGQYLREKDSRLRIQKQLCQPDPTGILGCLNGSTPYGSVNGNATLASVLTSKEFFAIRGLPTAFALGSLYGNDVYKGTVNPTDPRVINTDFNPQYYTQETILQGTLKQDIGDKFSLKIEGNYERVKIDSEQDYNNSVQDRSGFAAGLGALQAAAAGLLGPGLQAYLKPVAAALIPQGASGPLCTSLPEDTGTGVFGGHSICASTPLDFDRSRQDNESFTVESVLSSKFDGKFNFLLGGIYGKYKLRVNDYYVDSFGLDYFSGVVGAFTALGAGAPPSFLATPYYRNNTSDMKLNTFGIFGEAYYSFSDKVKLTAGLRYNDDKKTLTARTTLFNWLTPLGTADATTSPFIGSYDADPGLSGNQLYQVRTVHFKEVTGRAVLDWQITPDNLLYASYSRGYKSGGINPPLSPIFTVPEGFKPEFVNAFEIGSKNTFDNGKLQLNVTGFYYKYKDLQLSRIVARTSVNDNVSASIYGIEAEAIIRPIRAVTVNMSASYLHTSVSEDKFLANPRDFGAGRSDAVIIKDITNAANCAVGANTAGNVAGVNAFVNTVNGLINAGAIPGVKGGAGLQGTTSFGGPDSGIASRGAYSVCAVLDAVAASNGKAFDPAGITVYSSGIPVNIRGNKLPGAPNYKFSAGIQYEIPVGDLALTPRVDLVITGESTGSIFNGSINKIPSFTQANAQIQLDGPNKRWFIRGFIQNISNANSITGAYVTDQSSANFTNIFTLEPRRYGVAAGFKF
ncbi:TonB-dependent receptor [Novosphingobium sp. FKTRR1]|uniref:TonB-dependent receptor n=1 Tax=Novosphingobium sp. FKTRR1 TaxID=2879118 RepID=UPI001CEFF547|nr:TonB-dependent receptor [Novosphingobium sp. FKTRR1]